MSRIRVNDLRYPITKEDFKHRKEVTRGLMGAWFFFEEKKMLMFKGNKFSLAFQGIVVWGNMREFTYISFLTDSIDGLRVTKVTPNSVQFSKICKEIIFFDSSKGGVIYSTLDWNEFLKRASTTIMR